MEGGMDRKHTWSPAEGPDAAPQQTPRRAGHVSSGSGDDVTAARAAGRPPKALWRSDPGAGGGCSVIGPPARMIGMLTPRGYHGAT